MNRLYRGVAVSPETQAPSAWTNIAGATGALMFAGPGTLRDIVVNSAGAGTVITVYHATSATGATIGTIATLVPLRLTYNAALTKGLYVNVAGSSSDITAVYEKDDAGYRS